MSTKCLLWFYAFVTTFLFITCSEILEVQPQFRSIKLKWKADESQARLSEHDQKKARLSEHDQEKYLITYCEDQAWGKHRCRSLKVNGTEVVKNSTKTDNTTTDKKPAVLETQIDGLRMATNYTVEIEPIVEDRKKGTWVKKSAKRGRALAQNLFVQTKGFYAKTINCLANSSVVEIETGPYFGGQISVEGSYSNDCFVQGDFSSPKSSYVLKINHKKCGSDVKKYTVKTYLIVQENLPILTHSTRRFMIVCNYKPVTFTIRAGVNLPNEAENVGSLQPISNDIYEVDPSELLESGNKFLGSRSGRKLGRALRLSSVENKAEANKDENWTHSVLLVMLLVAAVIGLSFAIFFFVYKSQKIRRTTASTDSIIASEDSSSTSGSSCRDVELSLDDSVDFYNEIGPNFTPQSTHSSRFPTETLDKNFDDLSNDLNSQKFFNILTEKKAEIVDDFGENNFNSATNYISDGNLANDTCLVDNNLQETQKINLRTLTIGENLDLEKSDQSIDLDRSGQNVYLDKSDKNINIDQQTFYQTYECIYANPIDSLNQRNSTLNFDDDFIHQNSSLASNASISRSSSITPFDSLDNVFDKAVNALPEERV